MSAFLTDVLSTLVCSQTCKGTGVQVMIRPLGPGMVQQIQQRCSTCGGSGSVVPPNDLCGTCKGKGLVAEKKTFEVTIEPGMKQVRKEGA